MKASGPCSGTLSPPDIYSASGSLTWEGGTPGFSGPIGFTTGLDGSFSFTISPYDDGISPGNGTLSDEETLTLELFVDNGEVPVVASTVATVHNIAPTLEDIQLISGPYAEGPFWTFFATLEDVEYDGLTVTIDWGDDSDPIVITDLATGAFLWVEHTYYTNTTESYDIRVTVVDDDTAIDVFTAVAVVDPPIDVFANYLHGWEAQDLNYYVKSTSSYGEVAEYQFDLNLDGFFDHTDYHDPDIQGVLVQRASSPACLAAPATSMPPTVHTPSALLRRTKMSPIGQI